MKVVYLKMRYLPDLSDLGAPSSVNRERRLRDGVGERIVAPDSSMGRILIRDTWNTDSISALTPHSADLVVFKTRFSGFYATAMDDRLRAIGTKHLIVTGCTTRTCVYSKIRVPSSATASACLWSVARPNRDFSTCTSEAAETPSRLKRPTA